MDLYLYRHDQQTGPYTEVEARALVADGEITAQCLAWREGLSEWLPLEQVIALPPRPVHTQGLPPVPARPVKATGIKAWSDHLEKLLATTKFGPVVDQYGGRIGRVVWGIVLMIFIVKCRHGR